MLFCFVSASCKITTKQKPSRSTSCQQIDKKHGETGLFNNYMYSFMWFFALWYVLHVHIRMTYCTFLHVALSSYWIEGCRQNGENISQNKWIGTN